MMMLKLHLESLNESVITEFLTTKHLDVLSSFDCGKDGEEQTTFARELAWMAHRNCLSTVYIVRKVDNPDDIISYFTLSPFVVSIKIKSDMPEKRRELIEELKNKLRDWLGIDVRYSSIPTILLGQFGLKKEYRGQGIGKEILGKIIVPYAVVSAAKVGEIGLSLHANKKVAKKVYLAENPYLAGKFEVISPGGTYELFYPFVEEVRQLREQLVKNMPRKTSNRTNNS